MALALITRQPAKRSRPRNLCLLGRRGCTDGGVECASDDDVCRIGTTADWRGLHDASSAVLPRHTNQCPIARVIVVIGVASKCQRGPKAITCLRRIGQYGSLIHRSGTRVVWRRRKDRDGSSIDSCGAADRDVLARYPSNNLDRGIIRGRRSPAIGEANR
jgi:hypothetical protein